MEQEKQDLLMQRKKEKLGSFLAEALVMEEEELEAVCSERQMTQKLFNSIADKCIERIGQELDRFFYSFMADYPEYLNVYMERAEKIMDMAPDPKPEQEPWERILKKIRSGGTEGNNFS